MTFRNLTPTGDWTFGSGKNNYVKDSQEVALNVKTRVLSFFNDCFFAADEGINYWELLDYNKQEELENKIRSTIIETPGVTEVVQLDLLIGANRTFNVSYIISDIYSQNINETLPLNV